MLNNRKIKKWLLPLPLLWMGALWLPSGIAGRGITEFSDPSAYRSGLEAMAQPHGIMLADNHRTDGETDKTGATQSGDSREKAALEHENKTKPENKKAKSPKSFEPTEKVKADQAVDFPYDI